MGGKPDQARKHYRSQQCRSLRHALVHRLGIDFPRLGGERIRNCCVDIILEEFEKNLVPSNNLQHGQLLWRAVSRKSRPYKYQRAEETEMVSVVLTVSSPEDIERRLNAVERKEILMQKAVRLCREAEAQGGLLSNCDLAEIFGETDTKIAGLIRIYEAQHKCLIPRRATIHDVGSGLSHKGIICRKHYCEGKTSEQIARETHHDVESVDRYLGQFDRVRCCRRDGMSPIYTAHILECSLGLVGQYLALDDEIEAILGQNENAEMAKTNKRRRTIQDIGRNPGTPNHHRRKKEKP